jgi:hypothetical protein
MDDKIFKYTISNIHEVQESPYRTVCQLRIATNADDSATIMGYFGMGSGWDDIITLNTDGTYTVHEMDSTPNMLKYIPRGDDGRMINTTGEEMAINKMINELDKVQGRC